MSREIDERVVEMRFDNKQFESGVKESLGTIEKLKRSLDLKKAAASFDELGRSADRCDMSGLGRTVDMVSKKFSALETIAVGALLKIGSQAVTAGERLLKSLTVDQITSGWGKYADKTTAVQTIMAATGKSIDDVNGSLEKLIWFTDETSYSMTDMTSNIGKFTSQGVDLDKAVTAMEGISTWASLSGGSINEASRAMWNLSQALGAGAVKLQDWKSIETANMATKEFKEMAMEAAVATGDLAKSFDDTGNAIYMTSKGTKVTAANFASTLAEAWFSSDALISVLNNYGSYADGIYELYNNLGEGVEKTTSEIIGDMKRLRGADDQTILDAGYTEEQIDLVRRLSEEVGGVGQKSFAAAQEAKTFKEVIDSVKEAVASGWSRTFETIFGNYEEAKVLWTDLANVLWDVFASGGAARNELLQEALSVNGLNNFKAALADTGVTMDALQAKVAEMGRVRGVNLDGLIKQYGSFDEVLQNGAISAQLLRKATNAAFRELGENKIELLDELQLAIWAINDGVAGLSGREHLISAFWNAWDGVGALLSTVKDAFREIFPAKNAEQIYNFAKSLNELTERFKVFLTETKRGKALLTNLKNTFKGFFAVLDIAKQAVSALFRVVRPLIEQIFGLGEGALGVTGSLGEWLAKLDQTIKKNDTFFKVLSGVANVLGKVVGFIKDLAGKVGDKLELPSLDEFGESIRTFFETFSKRAGNGGLDRIKAFIGRLKEMDGISFKNIKAALKDFKENIIAYFFDFEGAFGKFGTIFDNIGNKIKGAFENISGRIKAALASIGLSFSSAGDKVSSFTTNVKEKTKNDFDSLTSFLIRVKDKVFGVALEIRNKLSDKIGIGEIFAVGLSTAMVLFTRKISNVISNITNPLAGVGSVLDSWSKQLSAKAWTERSKALKNAGQAVLAIGAGVLFLAMAMEKLNNVGDIENGLKLLSTLLLELVGTLTIIGASSIVIGKFSINAGSNLNKAGSAILKISIAVLLIAKAINSFGKIDTATMSRSKEVIEEFFGVFAAVAVAINLSSISIGKFSTGTSNFSKAGSAMLKMSASMLVISLALKSLGKIDTATMSRSKEVIEEFFGVFALLTMASGLSGKNATKAGKMILLMSVALIPLSAAIVMLSNLADPSGLDRALRAIEQILLIFGVLVTVTTFAGKSKGANKAIIAFTVAIAALTASVAALSLLDEDRLNGAVIALTILMGMLGLVIKMTEHATKTVGVIAMITAAVVAIAGVLTVMSLLDVQSALANAAALSLVLLSMAAALEILDGVGKISASTLLSMAVMEALVAGLAAIFWAMSELDVEPSIETAASLSILLLSMSAACVIVSEAGKAGIKAVAIGIVGLLAFIAGLGGLMAAISALTKDNPTVAEDLDRAVMVLEKIGAGIGSFIGGIIGGFAGGLTAGLPEIGQNLSDFMKNANYFISSAKNIDASSMAGVESLAGAILAITGAELLSSVMSWLSGGTSISEFGEQLAGFGSALNAYSISVKGIKSEDIAKSAEAGTAIANMAKAIPNEGGLLSRIVGENDMATFGEKFYNFGRALQRYSKAVLGLNVDAITASTTAGIAIANMAKEIPNEGGWLSKIVGENDMATFGEKFYNFGRALQRYSKAVLGLDVASIEASTTAGIAIANMAKEIPNEGGWLSKIVGENDMATFGEKFYNFGRALQKYSFAVTGLDVASIEASTTAGIAIAHMAKEIPNEGGWLSKIVGENDMATFGEQFYNFGRALQRYSTAVLGLDVDAIAASTLAGTSIIDMLKLIDAEGGVISWFTGEKDITGFGVQLDSFGNCLKIYSNSVTGLKTESINTSIDVATQLKALADSITGDADKLVAFGEDISSFGEKVGTLDATKLTAVTAYIQAISELSTAISSIQTGDFASLADSFRSLGESGIGELVRSFSTSDSKLTSAINGMIDTICRAASNGKAPVSNSMQDVATTMIGSFYRKALGITDSAALVISALCAALTAGSGSVSGAIQSVMSAAVGAVNNYYEKFYSAGVYAGQGFVLGIRSKLTAASTTGWNLGFAALEAARTAIKYGSPAKEFIDLGSIGVGDGFVIGMKAKKRAVENAGHDLGEASLEGLREALDAHSPAKETEEIGETGAGGGFVVGMQNSLPKVKAAAAKMGRTIVNTAKSEISKLGVDDEIKAVKDLTTEVKKSADVQQKATVKTYTVKNETVDASYQKSLDWIKREKEANRLSLEEEIAAYERMQARYIEGSKERIAIDKKLLELQKELAASYEKSMNWIEREKYYNRLTLVEELAAYKRVQSRYKAGTEEREKMDREVYRVEKEIYEAQKQYTADVQRVQEEANQKRLDLEQEYADKVSQVNQQLASDIQNLNDQYESALKSRTDSLYQSYGLFDKVAEREEVSGAELLDNLQGQVEEFNSWTSSLGALSARGVNEELIAELSDMGPSAISQIKALESMTDDELSRYVDLWTVKHVQAKTQATQELEGLRIETQNGIAQLRADAARELEEYRITWQQNMNQITVDANAELAQLRQDFEEKVGLIKKDTDLEMKEMAESARQILEEAGWDETGHQIVAGINEGIKEEKPKFIDTLTQMALDGVQAVNDTLEIESPSKVLRKSGNFAGLGLVLGLKDYASKAYDAGSYVAEQAKDGIGNAMQTVSDYLSGDMEARPTIRPVMDLTDVASGMSAVDSMFNTRQMLALAAQASYGFSVNEGNRELGVHVDNSSIIQELRSLRGDMGEMGDKIMKMQMVLDTGVLVGGIIDGVDSALGYRQVFKGRGI